MYQRIWGRARKAALTPAEVASPLGRRPYDLRHAALSTWLNAGVPATQVAEWAGNSVHVLLRVYAKCIVRQDDAARRRIENLLEDDGRGVRGYTTHAPRGVVAERNTAVMTQSKAVLARPSVASLLI